MPLDTWTAYLFQCGNEQLIAVTLDETGANLPRSSCTQGWLVRNVFSVRRAGARASRHQPRTDPAGHHCEGLLHLARRKCQQPKGTSQ